MQCKVSWHPGELQHGIRCVLDTGHGGECEFGVKDGTEIVVRIEPDGSLLALSGSGAEEVLDLRQFGPMTATRAGLVQFDEKNQCWEWRTVDGLYPGGRGGFLTRREAVAAEVAALSETL